MCALLSQTEHPLLENTCRALLSRKCESRRNQRSIAAKRTLNEPPLRRGSAWLHMVVRLYVLL